MTQENDNTTTESAPTTPSDNCAASTPTTAPMPSPSQNPGESPTLSPSEDSCTPPSTTMAVSSLSRSDQPHPHREYKTIRLTQINIPDPTNGRLELDQDAVQNLAQSIAADGLLNPITVTRLGNTYTLVAGRRRLAAVARLGWIEIPCIVQTDDGDRTDYATLVENTARLQLSPVEEGAQLARILANEPGGVEVIARRIGKRVEWILDRLDMQEWPDELLDAVHRRKISMGAGKHLARIEPPELRTQRIRDAVLNGISARTASLWRQDAEMYGNAAPPPPPPDGPPTASQYQTTTEAYCFVCASYRPLDQTTQVRICSACSQELAQTPQPKPQN